MFQRIKANRILPAVLAALIFGISMPQISYAASGDKFAETGIPELERENALSNTHSGEEPVITVLRTTELPLADDRSEESQSYIRVASGEHSERSVSLKRLNVLFSEKGYRFAERAREKEADSTRTFFFNYLSIIQYIHRQDGSKG